MTRFVALLVLAVVIAASAARSIAETDNASTGNGAIVELIGQRIDEAASELANLPPRIAVLREEYARLSRELQVVEPLPRAAPPDEDTAQEVVFRPPLEKVAKTPAMFVVCENGHLSIVGDNDSFNRVVAAAQGGAVEQSLYLSDGDFDLAGNTHSATLDLRAVRKRGAAGETADEVERPNAKFRQFLRMHAANKYHVQFNVYPDSHDVFRRARRLAWNAGFEVGWFPKVSGQEVRFGSGGENLVQ
jgi:hypothetical protein